MPIAFIALLQRPEEHWPCSNLVVSGSKKRCKERVPPPSFFYPSQKFPLLPPPFFSSFLLSHFFYSLCTTTDCSVNTGREKKVFSKLARARRTCCIRYIYTYLLTAAALHYVRYFRRAILETLRVRTDWQYFMVRCCSLMLPVLLAVCHRSILPTLRVSILAVFRILYVCTA